MAQTNRTPQTSRWITGGILAALSGLASACSDEPFTFRDRPRPSNVNVVFDPDVDFSQYQTFSLRDDLEEDDELAADLDPATRRDVELVNALAAAELRDLGLIEVSASEADLLAFSLGRTNSASGVTWSCVGGAWGGYWYWDFYYYDPCAWLDADYVRVDSTTLVVGLLDPELSAVVFTGFFRDVGDTRGPRRREIARAVADIFDQYPGRPGPLNGADAGGTDVPASDAGALDAGLPGVGLADAGSVDGGVLDDAGAGDAGVTDP